MRNVKERRGFSLLRSLAWFLPLCLLAYLLEHGVEHIIAGGDDHPELTQSIFNARGVYQYVVTSWPRHLVPRFTVLVDIDHNTDPTAITLHNICEQRKFLADLISALAGHDPAIIVVDKSFTTEDCQLDHPNTKFLQQVINEVSLRIPIVVGIQIDEESPPPTVREHFAWPIAKMLDFPDAPGLREGIVNTDMDSRRLPLGWTIRRTSQSEPEWRHALALEAAQAYDSKLLDKYPSLQQLVASQKDPYLSFIRREDFISYHAGDLLCTALQQPPELREPCERRASRNEDLAYLRGRIAIIGETHKYQDVHFTVIGHLPGFVLQANYIEALLDERYFRPVVWWVDYLLGFLFFVGVEAALRQDSPLQCFGSLIGVITLMLLLLSLTVRNLGYYVNPITVSALVLATKPIIWLSEYLSHKQGAQDET